VTVNMHLLAFAENSIQLFPDGTIFVHIALILAMIWILNRTLYRPINRVLETREKSKGGHSGEAAAILTQVGEKEARYTKELLEARTQGYELIEKEQRSAAAARDQKIADSKAASLAAFEAGRTNLDKQAAAARAEIDTEAEKMADRIAAGILGA
jgi:F0F1-type ATP synthase membrane subunit b/b'